MMIDVAKKEGSLEVVYTCADARAQELTVSYMKSPSMRVRDVDGI
jgi:hypothetical protein